MVEKILVVLRVWELHFYTNLVYLPHVFEVLLFFLFSKIVVLEQMGEDFSLTTQSHPTKYGIIKGLVSKFLELSKNLSVLLFMGEHSPGLQHNF